MKSLVAVALALLIASTLTAAGLPARTADPYLGAIAVDAATGDVLYENHADVQGYPASVVKLMDLLVILEKIEEGALKLDDPVTVTAESSTIGGSPWSSSPPTTPRPRSPSTSRARRTGSSS
jgi:D-alanyl-D-alanine carboxypeptidase